MIRKSIIALAATAAVGAAVADPDRRRPRGITTITAPRLPRRRLRRRVAAPVVVASCYQYQLGRDPPRSAPRPREHLRY